MLLIPNCTRNHAVTYTDHTVIPLKGISIVDRITTMIRSDIETPVLYFNIAETGGIAITPHLQSEEKPGFIMKPFFGVEPVLMDDNASVKSVTKADNTIHTIIVFTTNVPTYYEFSHSYIKVL